MKKDPIRPRQLERQLELRLDPKIDKESIDLDSPSASDSSDNENLFQRGSRKRPRALSQSPSEQSIAKENLAKQESDASGSSKDVLPAPDIKWSPKIVKTEDDALPLPDPFPLPKHYRSDVEVSLAKGKMTKETTSAFLSAVGAAMLVHKRYPTREDYISVSRTVVQKYGFMSSPVGTPYASVSVCVEIFPHTSH